MDEKGYIKAYRKTENDPIICKDNDYFRVWFYLLFHATHKEQKAIFKNKEIIVPKGSLITGRKKIAERCHISESKTDRILKQFEKYSKIEQQMSNKNRLITIVKWHLYQKDAQQVNNECTTSEHKQEYKSISSISSIEEIHTCVYQFYETNFAKLLSPIEKEELDTWIDYFQNEEILKYGIRVAVLNRVTTMNYLNGIFQNWKDNGYKTLEDCKPKPKEESKKIELFDYDWFEDEEPH